MPRGWGPRATSFEGGECEIFTRTTSLATEGSAPLEGLVLEFQEPDGASKADAPLWVQVGKYEADIMGKSLKEGIAVSICHLASDSEPHSYSHTDSHSTPVSLLNALSRSRSTEACDEDSAPAVSSTRSNKTKCSIASLLSRRPQKVSKHLASLGLLRGVPFSVLVRRLGGIFDASCGIAGGASEKTHAMSVELEPGSTYRAFISHSWQANACCKGLTLIHLKLFRPRPLLFLTAVVLCLASLSTVALVVKRQALGCTSRQPRICQAQEGSSYEELLVLERNRGYELFHVVQQLVGLSLVLVLVCVTVLFGHKCVDSRGDMYFLDKCSIDQSSTTRKRLGVAHLCEFIQASNEMIVLCDRSYLKRLWCVCELALFTHMRGTNCGLNWHLIWAAPAAYSLALVCGLAWFANILPDLTSWVTEASETALIIIWATVVVFVHLFGVAFVLWHRAAQRALRDLQTFSTRQAECSNEADRDQIYKLVASLWGPNVTEEEGLDKFDNFVQKDLRLQLRQQNFGWGKLIFRVLSPVVVLQLWLALVAAVPEQLARYVYRQRME